MAGSSMSRSMNRALRALAQAQREHERAQRRAFKEHERALRAAERAARADFVQNERERKRLYAEARQAECDAHNTEVALRLDDLDSILSATLLKDDHIHLPGLKKPMDTTRFDPGYLGVPKTAPNWRDYEPILPSGFGKFFGKSAHARKVREAREEYEKDLNNHVREEAQRLEQLKSKEENFCKEQAERNELILSHNAAIDSLMANLAARDPSAVCQYFELVLASSVYPIDFPQHFKLAYVPESKHLVCEYDFPSIDIVPAQKTFRYTKSKDEIVSSPRSLKETKSIYASVLAQIALRTVHEILESDRVGFVDAVSFNGMLEAINPGTGKLVRSCVVSFRSTRDQFEDLDLARVEPIACLRTLNAAVSKSPEELVAVKPIVEFNMVDQRFVGETDVLSELDERPNLLDLTPSEFEALIQNLFARMGLETKQTRASRDGGIDCVAYDARPIFGGKVVIQAKRYKNTVDVSAVRDLYGSMQNEGANKGILVTTSGYGPTAYEFAQGKPLELIDGSGLLHLLEEHADVSARILLNN